MGSQKEFALIVAGGYGNRMGSDIPKQFIPISGKPILMHTIDAFFRYSQDLILILMLPEDQISKWKELCEENKFSLPHLARPGGNTRFQSVKQGLGLIQDEGLVAIHDGVRPLVTPEIISASFRVAEKKGSAACAVKLKDSIRKIEGNNSFAVDRQDFLIMQTPQTFRTSLIKKAYEMNEQSDFTDDACVLEASGHTVELIEGSYSNIKITTMEDLKVAAAFL